MLPIEDEEWQRERDTPWLRFVPQVKKGEKVCSLMLTEWLLYARTCSILILASAEEMPRTNPMLGGAYQKGSLPQCTMPLQGNDHLSSWRRNLLFKHGHTWLLSARDSAAHSAKTSNFWFFSNFHLNSWWGFKWNWIQSEFPIILCEWTP